MEEEGKNRPEQSDGGVKTVVKGPIRPVRVVLAKSVVVMSALSTKVPEKRSVERSRLRALARGDKRHGLSAISPTRRMRGFLSLVWPLPWQQLD